MKSMIVSALFIVSVAVVSAVPSGYGHAPAVHVAAVPVVSHAKVGEVSHTPIYNVQKVHHTVHPISIPVHHPPVTSVHQEPTAVLAKAPKISGYAYTSDVRHDAPVRAIAHAAPVAVAAVGHADVGYGAVGAGYGAVAAAPVAAYGGAISHGAVGYGGDLGYAAAGPVASYGGAVAHGPAVEVGHAPAPYVSGTSLAVAPAVIKETPAVSSYQLNTGRIDTVTQQHYGTVHTPVVQKVGYQAHSVPVAVSHGGYGGHY